MSLNVLVVASSRSWNVLGPLSTTDMNISSHVVKPSNSAVTRFLDSFRATSEAIKNEDIDIILLDVYDIPGIAAVLASKLYNIPIVARQVGDRSGKLKDDRLMTEVQDFNLFGYVRKWVTYTLASPILAQADGVIAVSNHLKKLILENHNFGESDIEVIPVPLRTETFNLARDTTNTDNYTILIVTNLKYRGKFQGVLDSLQDLQKEIEERNNLHIVIAGDGRYKGKLLDFVDNSFSTEARNRINIRGYVEDISSLHNVSDIFLYISYLDGYPNAVLEAQAMKTAVITNRYGGMKDQVQHLHSGLFVEPDKNREISNAVLALMKNNNLKNYLEDNARKKVSKENSIDIVGDKMSDFIKYTYNNSSLHSEPA